MSERCGICIHIPQNLLIKNDKEVTSPMVQIIKAEADQFTLAMSSRLDTLRAVNHMAQEDGFSDELMRCTAEYLRTGEQTTVLAIDGEVIGCATICYTRVMPTPHHPSGKRAHVMNVHVREDYQRQGIARQMLERLIAEAKERGVTEITLDATDEGRPLYEKCGFAASDECMLLDVK